MNGITLGIARLSLDERRKVKGTAYAGGVLSYYGNHIAIDLDSLQFSGKQIPLLHNHDRDRCVGYGWLAREGKALTVHGEMLGNDHAAEIIKAADDGLEWQMSVHIEAGRGLTRHAGDIVNGEALAVDDVLVMTDGVIREVSFTPTGVDADTSANILSLSLTFQPTEPHINSVCGSEPEGAMPSQVNLTARKGGTSTKEIPMNKPDNTPDERDARIAELEAKLAQQQTESRLKELKALGIDGDNAATLAKAPDDVFAALTAQFAVQNKQQAVLGANYSGGEDKVQRRPNPLLKNKE